MFDPAVKRVGPAGLHPHELRHTAASLAIASGADVKIVQTTDEPVTEVVPDGLGGEVRMILDRHGERTFPQLWNQADMDTWREETGLRKPGANLHIPGVRGARPARDDSR